MINDNDHENISIEDKIKAIVTLRNTDRQLDIKEIALSLYEYLKSKNYVIIERKFLKTFFSQIENLRTQNRILKEVITELISKNKIVLTHKDKNQIQYRRKQLLTYDYGSYEMLLKKGVCYSDNSLSIVKTKSRYKVKAFLIL